MMKFHKVKNAIHDNRVDKQFFVFIHKLIRKGTGNTRVIDITWYNTDKTIILWKMKASWTNTNYTRAVEITQQMIITVSHIVDVISDMEQADRTPVNILNTVTHCYRSINERGLNYGITVMIHCDPVSKTMMQILNRLPDTTNRFYFAGSFEEAETLIHTIRSRQ